jgi:hypothetical protein
MQRLRHPRTHASHAPRPSTHQPGPGSKAVLLAFHATLAVWLASTPALALALVGTVIGLAAIAGAGFAGAAAVFRLSGYSARLRERTAAPVSGSTARSRSTGESTK